MKSLALVLLATLMGLASAKYAADLKQKYGGLVSEAFRVRPGIGVTIRRAPDSRVLEMLVAPIDSTDLFASRQMTFKREATDNVVKELVPESSRGKYIIGTFLNAQCLPENDCAGISEDYENVHITYNSAIESGKVRYVGIRFKN